MHENRSSIREGMTVFSSDGEKLGKVLSCGTASFTVEKGFFFRKDYAARYEDVADVTGDEIRLGMSKDAFVAVRDRESYAEAPAPAAPGEDVRVPIVEEEVDVTKRDRQAGEVRLRKDVVTEHQHVDVPVTRERVRVERVPTTEHRDAGPGEATFQEQTVSMPVHEEEVEIRKRPIVKEEVRLRKDRSVEQRAADVDVRKERVDVQGDGGARDVDDFSRTAGMRRDPGMPDAGPSTPRRDDEDLP